MTKNNSTDIVASVTRVLLGTIVIVLILASVHLGVSDSWIATSAAAAMLLLPWALAPKDPGPELWGHWKRDARHTFLWSVATFLPFALAFHLWFSFAGGISLNPEFNSSRISRFQPELRSNQHGSFLKEAASENEVRIWERRNEIFVFVPKGGAEVRVHIKPSNHETHPPPTPRRLMGGVFTKKQTGGSDLSWGERKLKPGHGFSFAVGNTKAIHVENPGDVPWIMKTPYESIEITSQSQEKLPRNLAWIPMMLLLHLFAVALPEEYFFRGFIQKNLRDKLPSIKIPLLPGKFPLAIVASSVLFAMVHLVATPDISRLAVFFPSLLFGWLYERSGNLSQPIAYHALSNVVLAIYEMIWFG